MIIQGSDRYNSDIDSVNSYYEKNGRKKINQLNTKQKKYIVDRFNEYAYEWLMLNKEVPFPNDFGAIRTKKLGKYQIERLMIDRTRLNKTTKLAKSWSFNEVILKQDEEAKRTIKKLRNNGIY